MQCFSETVVVREATSSDADSIAAVLEAAFSTVRSIYRPTAQLISRQTDGDSSTVRFIAEIDGRIVGTVECDYAADGLELIGLAVVPPFQQRGVARRLVELCTKHAREIGRDVVCLKTIKETGNVKIFKQLGFRVAGERTTADFVSDAFPVLHEVRMMQVVHPT